MNYTDNESDSDMKIVSDKPSRASDVTENAFDGETTLSELMRQKRYGNVGKARKAGSLAANNAVALLETVVLPVGAEQIVKAQCCCVLAFGIITGFERFICNDIIMRVALNTFYDTLKKLDEDFYESFNDLAAMSFYYLAARRNKEVETEVGPTFASLCKNDGVADYVNLGTQLFSDGVSIAEKSVKENGIR